MMLEGLLTAPTRWSDARRAVRAIGTKDGWSQALVAEGLASGVFHLAADGRTIALTEVFDGVCLLHRLSTAEVAGGFLHLDPDLTAFEVPLSIGLRTSCGERIELSTAAAAGGPQAGRPPSASPRVALGPSDWLDGLVAGAHVAVELFDETLVVRAIDPAALALGSVDPTVVANVKARAAQLMDRSVEHGGRRLAQLLAVLVEGVADGEELVPHDPTTPLATLLEACGLRHAHGWLTDDDTIDLDTMVGAEAGPSPVLPQGVAPSPTSMLCGAVARTRMRMADPYDGRRSLVLAALEDVETVSEIAAVAGRSPGIPPLVADLLPRASVDARAGLHHLAAVHHLACGRVEEAAAAFARSLDARDEEAVRDRLAQLRWICGDHAAAARLDPEHTPFIADLLPPAPTDEAMEEWMDLLPSYEDPGPDPVARARDLWRRARWYAVVDPVGDLHAHQQRAMARAGVLDSFPPEAVPDNLLEQFRGLARFAAEVGPLLSAEERRLLTRWLVRRRRWWRITDVEGAEVTLDRLDGGWGTTALGPWRADDDVDGWPREDELASALVLPTADPNQRILGGAMFCHAGVEDPAALPPAEDVIGTMAWICQGCDALGSWGGGLAA